MNPAIPPIIMANGDSFSPLRVGRKKSTMVTMIIARDIVESRVKIKIFY